LDWTTVVVVVVGGVVVVVVVGGVVVVVVVVVGGVVVVVVVPGVAVPDQIQLSTAMLVPQYAWHSALFGVLFPVG
jgi:hypothetical protein